MYITIATLFTITEQLANRNYKIEYFNNGQITLVDIVFLIQFTYHTCIYRNKGIFFKYAAARAPLLMFLEFTTTLDESEAYTLFSHINLPFNSFKVALIGLQCCRSPSIAVWALLIQLFLRRNLEDTGPPSFISN